MKSGKHAYLGQKLRHGAAWTYFQGGLGTLIQFGAGIVLARLLDPADFGVFFAVSAYIALLGAQVRFGLPTALLQAREVDELQWHSAFWAMQGLALVITLIVFAGSDLLAAFYGDDRYRSLMLLLCIPFFVTPFLITSESQLRRDMNFPMVSQAQIAGNLLGTALSLAAAFSGWGPYSLAVGGIASALIATLLLSRATRWFPRFRFSMAALRPLFRFSWRMHLNNSLSLAANRVDNMMIGRLAGLDLLGIYSRAFSVARLPVDNLCTPLYQLVVGTLSRIQDDHGQSRLMFRKVLCAVTSAVFPLLLWLIFDIEAFLYILYGEKWLPAAEPFRLLALGSFILVVSITQSSLAVAQNLLAQQTPILVLNLCLTMIAVLVGMRWGLSGVAIGISLKILITNVLQMRVIRRSHLAIGWDDFARALLPASLASLLTLAPALFAREVLQDHGLSLTNVRYLLGMSMVVLLSYGGFWYAIARWRSDDPAVSASLNLAHGLLSRLLPGRASA